MGKNRDMFGQSTDNSSYFAAASAEETANSVLFKANDWYNNLHNNGYLDKVRMMWAAYHGAYYSDVDNGHSIQFGGEQGELTMISINHLRNLAQHMLTMITANRPAMQARSINTDYKSLVQTKLANGLLDYYMREKRLEDYLKTAAEYAIVMGSGYIKMEWNETSGEVYDVNELDIEVKEGDVEFSNLSPFDVVFDSNVEDNNHDWVVTRSFKNRHDIVAKYPDYKDKILSLPTKDKLQGVYFERYSYDETDLIPVYEFYHKRSEALPDGRYMLFLSDDTVLIDSPMPYRNLPVYRISPSNILGTPYGYTNLFDILPIQDAINSLYSTVLTNQSAFGVQNILVPRGADVSFEALSGGLNVIEANQQFGKVEALNLTNTPDEVFKFMGILEQSMETISGINSVARGNPESSLKSGTALALVQSMSIQFMSGLQQSYVKLLEDTGTGLVNMLKDFASVPRVATIVGEKNRTYMKEFVGGDLSSVNRVIVDVGNPLSKTTAGRVEMAEQLLQMGAIKTPEEYITIINTGQLDVMTEDTQSELLLIRSENEKLIQNEDVVAIATDQHAIHIKEHKSVLADPDLRFDPELTSRVLKHIQEHIDLLRTTDPDLLMLMQEQPLGPKGGSPANQPMPDVNQSALNGQLPDVGAPPTQLVQQGVDISGQIPDLPQPPAPFENAPVNPEDLLPES